MADSERDRLEALARALIHRFNNVLMGIQPHVELIKRAGKENEKVLGSATQIETTLRRAKSMMLEVAQLARPAALEFESIEVTGWFDSMRREVQPAAMNPVDLTFEAASGLTLSGDRNELTRVIVNLVNNAVESMPQGGAIAVSARSVPDGIEVAVIDNGSGMTPEVLQRMFEPLFTTKRNASGLGLPVVQRIIQAHGGTVRIDSKVGSGTTVTIVMRHP